MDKLTQDKFFRQVYTEYARSAQDKLVRSPFAKATDG